MHDSGLDHGMRKFAFDQERIDAALDLSQPGHITIFIPF